MPFKPIAGSWYGNIFFYSSEKHLNRPVSVLKGEMLRSNHAGVHLNSILFSLLGALFFSSLAFSQDAENTIHQSGFERDDGFVAGDVNGQLGWTVDRGRAEVTDGSGLDNGGGLTIFPSDPFGQVSVRFDGARLDRDVVFIDFFVRPVAGEGREAQFADAEGSVLGFFKVNSDGALEVLDGDGSGETEGTWVSTGVSLPLADDDDRAGEFLRLTLRQDFREGNRVWDLYVDGELTVADAGFWTDEPDDLRRFSLMGHSEFPLVIDNVTISSANMLFADADADGLPDEWQKALGEKSGRDDDADGDGLSNIGEYQAGTDGLLADSDGDSVSDGDEWERGDDPLDAVDNDHDILADLSEAELFDKVIVLPLPFHATRAGTETERRTLLKALRKYLGARESGDIEPLEDYARSNPGSPYLLWVESNLGDLAYNAGRFSKALGVYERVWGKYKSESVETPELRSLVNATGVGLARLYSRLGRKANLVGILAEFENRTVAGYQRERLYAAKQALGIMNVHPTKSFNCGTYALESIRKARGLSADDETGKMLRGSESTEQGFSLDQVEDFAERAGLGLEMVRRNVGEAVLVPSVVHWKSGHYAAVTEKTDNDEYRVVDPTFGKTFIMSAKHFNEEASGYFLVNAGNLPVGWDRIDAEEGRTVRGRGAPTGQDENDPCHDDCEGGGKGMASYAFNRFRASLVISDTPLAYDTPIGASMNFTATYFHAQQSNIATLSYSNIGSRWFLNWMSYVEPLSGSDTKYVYTLDGRKEAYYYNSSTGEYDPQMHSGNTISFSTSSFSGYTVTATDGSYLEYAEQGKEAGDPEEDKRYFLTKIVDSRGNETTIDYDSLTRIETITDSLGNEIDFSYTSSGNSYLVTDITDTRSTDRSAEFEYDSSKRLTKITDVEGIESSFQYDGFSSFIETMTTPYGDTDFDFSESSAGRWLEIEDPENLKQRIEYKHEWTTPDNLPGVDSGGWADTVEIPAVGGIVVVKLHYGATLYWDKKAMKDAGTTSPPPYNLAHQTDWLESPYTVSNGLPVSERSALAHRVFYEYDLSGTRPLVTAVASRIKDYTGNHVDKITEYEYSAAGLVTKETDPSGRITSYTYDGSNNLLKVLQDENGTNKLLREFKDYNSDRLPETIIDAGGNQTTVTYNSKGQPDVVTDAEGNKTKFTYDEDPNTSQNGNFGYLVKVEKTDPDNSGAYVTVMEITDYDGFDRPSTIENADGYEIDIEYDKLNRTTKVTHPDATYEQYYYTDNTSGDKLLDLTKIRDREGNETKRSYNGNRQLIETEDAEGRVTELEWCSCGDLEKLIQVVTGATDKETTWHRDLHGRVTSKVYPDGKTISYAYQPESGKLSTVTHPNDQGSGHVTKTLTYYKDGNLRKVDYHDSATTDSTYYYDSEYNRLTQRNDSGIGNWYYTYVPINGSTNGGGRLYSSHGPLSYDLVQYSYDDVGRVSQRWMRTYSAVDHKVSWDYDSLGRLERETTEIGDFDYSYIGDSNLVDYIDYENGQRADYDYLSHANGRFLKQIRHTKTAGGAMFSQRDYLSYSAGGQIGELQRTMPTSAGGSTTFRKDVMAYDDVYQLTDSDEKTLFNSLLKSYDFTYDEEGNRTQKKIDTSTTSYYDNSRNQITTQIGNGFVSFVYDSNGNRTERNVSGGQQTVYEWDGENRLKAFQSDKVPVAGTKRTEFTYNGLGQRYKKVEKTYTSGSTYTVDSTEYYRWCDGKLVQRRVGGTSRTHIKNNYYSLGESRHTSTAGSAKKDYYYTKDHLGTIHEMTDSSVSVKAAYRYTPYGVRTKQGFSTMDCDFGFTGHYHHEVSGLVLTWHRAYDPDMGRWLSADPLENVTGRIAEMLAEGPNLYGYVGNNPEMGVDLLGLFLTSCSKPSRPRLPKMNRLPLATLARAMKENEKMLEKVRDIAAGHGSFPETTTHGGSAGVVKGTGDPHDTQTCVDIFENRFKNLLDSEGDYRLRMKNHGFDADKEWDWDQANQEMFASEYMLPRLEKYQEQLQQAWDNWKYKKW